MFRQDYFFQHDSVYGFFLILGDAGHTRIPKPLESVLETKAYRMGVAALSLRKGLSNCGCLAPQARCKAYPGRRSQNGPEHELALHRADNTQSGTTTKHAPGLQARARSGNDTDTLDSC